MNLVKIVKSKKMNKKYDAIFKKDFGQANANDYTITKDKEARARYRKRHAKDLKTNDPTRAGYLSYHLLWGDSTNLQTNISEYKKRFKL